MAAQLVRVANDLVVEVSEIQSFVTREDMSVLAMKNGTKWTWAGTAPHVASASGLSRTYLSEVEHGKANLTIATLERIADAFDVDPLVFLGGDAGEVKRRMLAEGRLERIRAIADEGN